MKGLCVNIFESEFTLSLRLVESEIKFYSINHTVFSGFLDISNLPVIGRLFLGLESSNWP